MRKAPLARTIATLLPAASLLSALPHAAGQCRSLLPGPMNAFPEGVVGVARCSVVWDHDNFAGTPPLLVVGGELTAAGGIACNRIAAWDGRTWRALGSGVTNTAGLSSVQSLTVYNGELIVGGQFNVAGGVGVTNVARWNGSSWLAMGSNLTGAVQALEVYQNTVVAGGTTSNAALKFAAKWNGSTWVSMAGSTSLELDGAINTLKINPNGFQLIAGGYFTHIGATFTANRVAYHQVDHWGEYPQALADGVGGGEPSAHIRAIAFESASNPILAGRFSNAVVSGGTIPCNNIVRWNSGWDVMGTGLGGPSNSVLALAYDDIGQLWAGGDFTTAGATTVNRIARYSVGNWVPTGGFNLPVLSLVRYDRDIAQLERPMVATGIFTTGGTRTCTGVARTYNGGDWKACRNAPPINAMAAGGGFIIAGGDFVYNTPSGVAHYLYAWNGTSLTPLSGVGGEGTNGAVRALKVVNTGPFISNLYIGGDFTAAGGVPANRIIRKGLTTADWSTLGAGLNGGVWAIEQHAGSLYTAGLFTGQGSGGSTLNHVARWDGTNWVPVGTGLDGWVTCLKSWHGDLYAGGYFAFAGGASTPYIARWNGTTWNTMSIGTNNPVFALTIDAATDTLVVGGNFNNAGGLLAKGVARWNGTNWSAIGNGLDGIVTSLHYANNRLYAGGSFKTDTVYNDHLAESTGGNWTRPDGQGGINDVVNALSNFGAEVHFGGAFSDAGAGAAGDSPAWGKLIDRAQPRFSQQPQTYFTSLCPGSTAQFSAALTSDYTGYTYQWKRDGVALVNGPTPWGSTISGATGTQLTISGLSAPDGGSYACSVTNAACGGNASSSTASLPVCFGNCDCSSAAPILNVSDFSCFLQKYAANNLQANCDGSTLAPVLNVNDFTCFLQKYANGCL